MLLSQALVLYRQSLDARKLSEHTKHDYGLTLRRFIFFVGDVDVDGITSSHVREFLGSFESVGKKTVKNYWIALSAFWSFMVNEEICLRHVVRKVRPPKPEKRVIRPYTSAEMLLLDVAAGRGHCAVRDKAIIRVLLDTGMRASELSGLRVCDYFGSSLLVFGKGDKERVLPLSSVAIEFLQDYLNTRGVLSSDDFLFVGVRGEKFSRHALRSLLGRLGLRGGVLKVHAHRFRHTCAISFLRNGGDAYNLQLLLGHSELDMVKTYLAIAQSDLVNVHRKASPVLSLMSQGVQIGSSP